VVYLVALLGWSALVFRWRKGHTLLRGLSERGKNAYVVLWTISTVLIAVEVVLRLLPPQSAAFTSVVHQRWAAHYWHPINSLGYRDVELASEDLINVLVVGDSFMAGYGIRSIEDRLSGILQSSLGNEYGVNIAAQSSWETNHQFAAIQMYPVSPDIIVWSHVGNDILWTLPTYPAVYTYSVVDRFADNFYMTTYAYRTFFGREKDTVVPALYADPTAFAQHTALLQEVIDWCMSRDIRLIFVVWDISNANEVAPYILPFLDEAGMDYVDMGTQLMGRPIPEITAGFFDGHPNSAVYREAAQMLLPLIQGG
jgi:hypothetical protein